MIKQLKILKGLSEDVVKIRATRFKYQTNRAIKGYSLWVFLKNETTSGYIQDVEQQLHYLLPLLKISRKSFYNYLNYAQQCNLIERHKGVIKLASYEQVMEDLSLYDKEFLIINYDTNNEKQKIEYIIRTIEIYENTEFQQIGIEAKLSKNSMIKSAFQLYCLQKGLNYSFNMDNLAKVQKQLFETGGAERIYEPLMNIINPHISRNSASIREAHNLKSRRSVTYLKKQLKKAGLIGIYQNEKATCTYNQTPIEGHKRGSKKDAFCFYSSKSKVKVWHLPQQLIINPFIIEKKQPTEKNQSPKAA